MSFPPPALAPLPRLLPLQPTPRGLCHWDLGGYTGSNQGPGNPKVLDILLLPTTCPPSQGLAVGPRLGLGLQQGRSRRPQKSQLPGHSLLYGVEHLSGGHPERSQVGGRPDLPRPSQTGQAGLGSGWGGSQDWAVLASQGKPGPKGRGGEGWGGRGSTLSPEVTVETSKECSPGRASGARRGCSRIISH